MNQVLRSSLAKRTFWAVSVAGAALCIGPAHAHGESFTYNPEELPFIGYQGLEYGTSGQHHDVEVTYARTASADGKLGFIIEPYGSTDLSASLAVAKEASLEQRLVLYYGAPKNPAPRGLTQKEWIYATQAALWCTKQAGEPRFTLEGLQAAMDQEELFAKIKPHIASLVHKAQQGDPYPYSFVHAVEHWTQQEDGSWLLKIGGIRAGAAWNASVSASGIETLAVADKNGAAKTQAKDGDDLYLKFPAQGVTPGTVSVTIDPKTYLPSYTLWTSNDPTSSRDVISTRPGKSGVQLTKDYQVSTVEASVVDPDGNPVAHALVVLQRQGDEQRVKTNEKGKVAVPLTDQRIKVFATHGNEVSKPQELTISAGKSHPVTLTVGEAVGLECPANTTVKEKVLMEPLTATVTPAGAALAASGLPGGTALEGTTISGTPLIADWGAQEESRVHGVKLTATLNVRSEDGSFDLTVLRDTDGDGTPDVEDADDDNDGFADTVEDAAGSNPKDPASIPAMTLTPAPTIEKVPDTVLKEKVPMVPLVLVSDPKEAKIDAAPLPQGLAVEKDAITGTPLLDDWGPTEEIRVFETEASATHEGAFARTDFKITVMRDTDGDGLPDISDADDDNDGYTDEEEIREKTDPKDPASHPTKKPSPVSLSIGPLSDATVIEHREISPIGVPSTPDAAEVMVVGLPKGLVYHKDQKVIQGMTAIENWGATEEERLFRSEATARWDGKARSGHFNVTVLRDTDKDGTPDISDTDDDNDGYSDLEEKKAGTDPKDPDSHPAPEKPAPKPHEEGASRNDRGVKKDEPKGLRTKLEKPKAPIDHDKAGTQAEKRGKLPKTGDRTDLLAWALGLIGISIAGSTLAKRGHAQQAKRR